MEEFRPSSFLVLYGSETGTAEEVAFKIHRHFSQRRLTFSISSLDEYDVSKLPSETCILWVVATAGEGEVPSNMKKFWNFLLRRNLSSDSLKGVSCAVFGLGDSSYEKFNSAARYVLRLMVFNSI
jgi:sulfite reductase alpha subunit-like flavoprotein